MKGITNIAFYYTLFAITLIACVSFFYVDMPYSAFQTVLLLPSLLYMWLRITNPERATEATWSSRLLIVIIVLISLGVFSIYLLRQGGKNSDVNSSDSTNSELTASLSAEIKALKVELNSIKDIEDNQIATKSSQTDTEIADLINSLPSPQPSIEPSKSDSNYIKEGQIRIRPTSGTDVFKEANANSKIIGVAIGGDTYSYYETSGEWYLIEFEDSLYGWVQQQDVQKLN